MFSPQEVARRRAHAAKRKARWLVTNVPGKLVSSLWSIALENPVFAKLVQEELVLQRENRNATKRKESP